MPVETDQLSALLTFVSDPVKSKERLDEIKALEDRRDKAYAVIKESNDKLREINEKEEDLERQEEELAKRLTAVVKREFAVMEAEKQLQAESAKRLAEWQDRELAVSRMESEATERAKQAAQDVGQSERLRALWEKKHMLIKEAEALG